MTAASNDLLTSVAPVAEDVLPNRLRNPAYLRRDATRYLDGVAGEIGAIKEAIREISQPRLGLRLLDVGCGTGTDAVALADRVGEQGYVVGVDTSEQLVAEAQNRIGERSWLEFRTGDACALPFPDASFDGVRAERVLQHVADTAMAVREMVRVTRPGGRIVLAEPDHDMWAVNCLDVAVTRQLMAWWVDHIRHPWMGRQLPGLLADTGVQDIRIDVLPVVLTSLASAEAVIGLAKVAGAAGAAGVLPADQAEAWHRDLVSRDAAGDLLTLGAIVVASGRTPDGSR
jgi:ubiquinone/menaquinone biosynthesis C-methylase UbiE